MCSRFPHGAQNVTFLTFALGIGVGLMIRFLAWNSQAVFISGMVFVYFGFNSFQSLVAAMSTEVYGSRGKQALGLIYSGFSPGAFIGGKVESTVGIEQYYSFFV